MSPVQKTGASAESIAPHLNDPVLIGKLNQQNIWEVLSSLPGDYTKQDIIDYLKFKSEQLTDIVQNYKTMSAYAEPGENAQMMEMQAGAEFSKEDVQEFSAMLTDFFVSKSASGKAAATTGKAATMGPKAVTGAKAADKGDINKAPTGAQVIAGGEQLLSDANKQVEELMSTIFTAQLQMQMEKKNDELKEELRRILALVRSGKADAVFLFIILAKVNVNKAGMLASHKITEVKNGMAESAKVMEELYGKENKYTDTEFAANLQMGTQKQKEINTQQQFLFQDIQKLTQHIETFMGFAKGAIDETFKTRLQMINAISKY